MPIDRISEEKIKLLHPLLAEKIRSASVILEAEGIPFTVVQGLRSWAEQDKLFLKGRDEQGNIIDQSQIVTNARAGYSWHAFGLAADLCPTALLAIHGWGTGRPEWHRLQSVVESLGLVSGSRWHKPDWPHVQFTGKFPVTPTGEVRQLFKDGGTIAVWQEAFPE